MYINHLPIAYQLLSIIFYNASKLYSLICESLCLPCFMINFLAPKIESVSQIGENSVKISWSSQSSSISRYKILVTNDNWNTSYEWPSKS